MGKIAIVKEVMSTSIAIVKPTIAVLEAAKIMREKKVGNVIVVEQKQPIGILTESDILKKLVADGKDPKDIFVKDVMSTPIIVIDPYATLEDAIKIMGKCKVRRLPVIENNELIGIITQKDISKISPILHEIAREWYHITSRDEAFFKKQIFSGKCEDCGTLTSNLKNVDGQMLCEECSEETDLDQK